MKRMLSLLMALAMMASLAACGGGDTAPEDDTAGETAGAETQEPAEGGRLRRGGRRAHRRHGVRLRPLQLDPERRLQRRRAHLKDSGAYANGYDVMMAKQICEANGWELEVVRTDWDSLVPGVQSGVYDAVIAGQSMTADRMEQVDLAGPYYYATIVCVTKADSPYASAQGISDLSGGTCTAQIGTIWYDSMPAPDRGRPDPVRRRDRPRHAHGPGDRHRGLHLHRYAHRHGRRGRLSRPGDPGLLRHRRRLPVRQERAGDINIGVSVMKGNTALKDAIDSVLSTMTADDFNAMMDEAIAIQPLSEG